MKTCRIALMLLASFSLASCSSDEPQWADPEAHEKMEQLNEQYGRLLVGTWHIESIKDKERHYEQLTFFADGALKGIRKRQARESVTVDGEERYTDWRDVEQENGTFTGTWKLSWEREAEGLPGTKRLLLLASFDEHQDWPSFGIYNLNATFINADATSLCFRGGIVHNGEEGETIYTRGEAEPSFE